MKKQHVIYDLYLSGQSVIGIIKELEKRKILSPTVKEKWCKKSLWGLEKGLKDGTSQLYNRRCFGYRKNKNGDLEIYPEEVEIVKLII